MNSRFDMRQQINLAAAALCLKPTEFRQIRVHQYQDILLSIIDHFTTLGRKGWNAPWWDHFKGVEIGIHTTDAYKLLPELVPSEERVWFVAEDWGRNKRDGGFWLFEGKIQAIVSVLGEMFGFEYYVVSKKFEWLLCENHHDILIGVGQPMVDKMRELKSRNHG